jgi:hypothetical protein|tara:strand:- start:1936 stop:2793 length:858 start_codon:yes stop_codon:yes gene_type:complete
MTRLWILGPGHSLSRHEEHVKALAQKEHSVMAFQRVFPNCVKHFDLIPDYWFSADPFPWLEGFEFLTSLPPVQQEKFKKMKILIPSYAAGSYADFRLYSGTTPLARTDRGWERYQVLTQHLMGKGFDIQILPCTTSKYLATTGPNLPGDIFDSGAYLRFMGDEIYFGTVPFDSETVMGDQFKWGLENKLSSNVFPVAFHLGYKELCIAGFDFKGPRFYNDVARHPWSDETQKGKNLHQYPLGLVKKWADWEPLHGMSISSVVGKEYTMLSDVLPTRKIADLLETK